MKTTTSETHALVRNFEDIFATFQVHSRIAFAQFRCLSAQWNSPSMYFIPSVAGRNCLDCTAGELAVELVNFCEQYRLKRSPETIVFNEYTVDCIGPGLFTVTAVYDNPYQLAHDRFLGHRT